MELEVKWNMKKIEEDMNQNDIECNKYVLELVNSWINNADSKISIACGISSVVFAVIAFGAENFLSKIHVKEVNEFLIILFYITAVIAGLTFLSGLWFYFWALNPSLTSAKNPIRKPKYSIFYDDIKKFSNVDDYIKCVSQASIRDFNKELLLEIYINSGICSKKMRCFKIGMWLSVIAIAAAVLGSAFYYFALI